MSGKICSFIRRNPDSGVCRILGMAVCVIQLDINCLNTGNCNVPIYNNMSIGFTKAH